MGKLGYTHGNTGDERARLKTQQHVLEMRSQYLATIARLRAKGYLVLYQDETWVNKNTTKKKSWHRKVDKDGDFVPTDLPDNVENDDLVVMLSLSSSGSSEASDSSDDDGDDATAAN